VDNEGFADVMLVSEAPGEVDIDLALYYQRLITGPPGGLPTVELRQPNDPQGPILNQHGFVVFYLKLEDVKLSDVRESGNFTMPVSDPANPWDVTKEPWCAL